MENIKLISSKIVEYLKINNITSETKLELGKKIKLIYQIKKETSQIKEIVEEMKDLDNSKKISKFLEIIIRILDSEEIKQVLTFEQISEIKNIVTEAEVLETVVEMVEHVYKEVPLFKNMDDNNDGVVTKEEVINNVNCFGNKTASSCFASIYLKCCCCKKNK